ncbi:hypothetical protein F4553_005308 [Allocatelliglobosispora scoriae]|uniref:Uncharacterized protein n=1 Tax=Allocatelliglobosispora scoriae TaxID=643052 RepID=A0A841BXR5_9ACTN|nr:hypothetical protein [Allocatelliglobosispora scoriae]MBB5871929.1 hypothetical protein [Allocatelliglobosispora scoriae]
MSLEDSMLKHTWYLTDGDWFAQLPGAPRLDDDGQAVIEQVARLFHDESYYSVAKTVATTDVILVAVEHLGDNLTYAVRRHDLIELSRLLNGLNLIQAHLTQIVQFLAERVDARAFDELSDVPAADLRALTDSLSTAGTNGEVCAGHLKEAHLTLRRLTK